MNDAAQWRVVLGGVFVAGIVLGFVLRGAARATARAAAGLLVFAALGVLGYSGYRASQAATATAESCPEGDVVSRYTTQAGVRLWVCGAGAQYRLYSRGAIDASGLGLPPQGLRIDRDGASWTSSYDGDVGQVEIHIGADGLTIGSAGQPEPTVEDPVTSASTGTT